MRQIESNIKGFTLIEVMIALIVLMIGILGLMRLTTYNFQRVTSANERNIGFRIAKMALEPDNIQPGTKCLITFTFKKKDVEAMGIEVQSKKIYIRSKIKSHEIK